MNDKLIEEYIIYNYIFSSNIDGWCVLDRYTDRNILLRRLIRDIEKIFPDMGGVEVCQHWWDKNIQMITYKISTHMCTYQLKLTNKPMVWSVINHFGKEFDNRDLMKLVPNHHSETAIYKLFDEWFDEKIFEATKIEIGEK